MEIRDINEYPTPKEIVEQLNKYIIGQEEAKRAVAVAMRNHVRRKLLPEEKAKEIIPKNILMIGPTGVGKTELARRLAMIMKSPFIKVEVTQYTEVGYVGKDVASMVRDLVEVSVRMVKDEEMRKYEKVAEEKAYRKVASILVERGLGGEAVDNVTVMEKLKRGEYDDYEVEVEVFERKRGMEHFVAIGFEEIGVDLSEIFEELVPPRKRRRRMKVKNAVKLLKHRELEMLIDMDSVVERGRDLAESQGIIFIDEIDKVAGAEGGAGPDVSRYGVQRDLLPIVEGTTVNTRYGPVKTDYILFIAAGAFSTAKVSDLLPELQGRFPVRVELHSLTAEDFKRILVEPENALTKQYKELLGVEGVELEFTPDGVEEIAEMAFRLNEEVLDIGARRLHTVMEKLLEDVSFHASEMEGAVVKIDRNFVRSKLKDLLEERESRRFIL